MSPVIHLLLQMNWKAMKILNHLMIAMQDSCLVRLITLCFFLFQTLMNVKQYLACVREESVSTAMDPLHVSVPRARCGTPTPTHVRTVMSVMMKTPVSMADALTLTAATTAAAAQVTSPVRTAKAA